MSTSYYSPIYIQNNTSLENASNQIMIGIHNYVASITIYKVQYNAFCTIRWHYFDEAFLSYLGGIQNNDLKTVLDINDIDTNEPQTIRHSSYYDYDTFNELIINKKDRFSILSSNIKSINSKFKSLTNWRRL